ncbi:MAG TPA: cyclic peptide export ABC transporter [Candidatus Angelobacter sp.]|jgi:putative pyoverdin transport system ATP-binding/permease protein|nr:cyclic peptide export ABC transporter [Candidatus Angelobacter sp.]
MKDILHLFFVLLKWSSRVKGSRIKVVCAIVLGAVAGFGSTGLIAVANAVLSAEASRQMAVAFFALCAVVPICGFISQAFVVQLTTQAAEYLQVELSEQMLKAPYRLLEDLGAHKLLAVITDDIPAVTTAIGSLPILLIQLAIMAGCLAYLGWLSRPLLLLVMLYMSLGITSYRLPVLKELEFFRLMREAHDLFFKALSALTDGAKELKLNRVRRDDFLAQQLRPAAGELRRFGNKANVVAAAGSQWGQILFFIFIGLVMFFTPLLVAVNRRAMIGYTLTILFMISPLTLILSMLPVLGKAAVAARKVENLGLSLAQFPPEKTAESSGASSWQRLELMGISHTYRHDGKPGDFCLGPLNLGFERGEMVFLIGGNGSGKTTLAKILMGLYEPDAGYIRIDGKTITAENRDEYRQNFSVVFFDFYLFENFYGLDRRDIEMRAPEYLDRLQLNHKVRIIDGKLSSVDLSQGQRKRLALLAAYLEDRTFYVFDEWAADQDPVFKQIFYHRILPELKSRQKTVLVISHDDRYYGVADRLIRLENGQLEWDGKPFDSDHRRDTPTAVC